MSIRSNVLFPILVSFSLSVALTAQVIRNHDMAVKNWPAPLYWQPSQAETEAARARLDPAIRPPTPEAATPAGSLVFVAMTPCRVVDTRASQMFPAPFGIGSLMANTARDFPIQSSTLCTIPSTAQAYSFNVTVIPNPLGTPIGYLTIWPTASSPNTPPNAVTLDDFPTGDIRNNAAIVPAGITNGSVSAITNGNNVDLVLDINGYFAPSTGITLAQGTAAAPSLSFAGDAGTGIFSSGAGALNFATGGTNRLTVRSDGDLDLTGNIRQGGTLFAHTLAGATAIGKGALNPFSTGNVNTAIGGATLFLNTTGSANTALGFDALDVNSTGNRNTASGFNAVGWNATGSDNTASGYNALGNMNNNTGSNNTALGSNAGGNITNGSNNIDIGNFGLASDGTAANSGVIRIGMSSTQKSFFAAGINGVMTGGAGTAVLVDSNGQLGTISSSRRFKEDIQDMDDASSGLLRLRPVTYRYQQPYADGSKPIDYGLIAEEVAEIYPDLVVKSAEGQIETVQYHKLTPMLLNELQREHETVRALQAQVSALRKEHETSQTLQTQVSALQKALETLIASKALSR